MTGRTRPLAMQALPRPAERGEGAERSEAGEGQDRDELRAARGLQYPSPGSSFALADLSPLARGEVIRVRSTKRAI